MNELFESDDGVNSILIAMNQIIDANNRANDPIFENKLFPNAHAFADAMQSQAIMENMVTIDGDRSFRDRETFDRTVRDLPNALKNAAKLFRHVHELNNSFTNEEKAHLGTLNRLEPLACLADEFASLHDSLQEQGHKNARRF